jgi:chromosome segregation ATPase
VGLFDRQNAALEAAKAELDTTILALKAELKNLEAERAARVKVTDLDKVIAKLKEEITGLKIEKSKLDEDNAREKREVMHMVGLERKRQEAEAEQAKKELETAKREATLAVREENLRSEREAFEKSMKFQEERFKKEVGYLKDLMGQILERLPTVTVDRKIEDRTSTKS